MKAILCAAAGLAMLALSVPVTAQPAGAGGPTQAQIAQAHTLFDQMDAACSAGSTKRSCGVLVYSPEDCATARKKDGHVRQVYATNATTHMVRFQQNNTGVANQRPIALLQPFGIIDRDGKTTRFVDPVFVSWDEYQKGKRDVETCGQKTHLEVKDFDLEPMLQKFLKANP
ncbi:MAG TPA: hypothetical protein VG942_09650 [Hyphomonadaceae bacterium]|nr:hypothetical protein [Hyphomonadaceae bacterium]